MNAKPWRFKELAAVFFLPLASFGVTLLWLLAMHTPGAAGREALIDATKRGDTAAVEAALAQATPVDCIEPGSRMTPLMYAARFGRHDIAKRLLARGADVHVVTRGCGTPLAYAARGGHDEVIRLLLQHGANPNACAPEGYSPLMCAAGYGRAATVDLLVQAGADPNAADRHGNTALIVAAAQGHLDVLHRLVAAGANLDARDAEGFDAEAIARRDRENEAARLLQRAKANSK
jgi:uncharacterized protein